VLKLSIIKRTPAVVNTKQIAEIFQIPEHQDQAVEKKYFKI
jgi:hypothetical protein